MRQIVAGETNINLKYVYFTIYSIDGVTPADSEDGNQPEININNSGWVTQHIGLLESMGYGKYRALLSDEILLSGNIILSHYLSSNTKDAFGEDIQVVDTLSKIPIFEYENEWNNDNIINLTYVNIPEAEQYFSTRLNSEAWDTAQQKDKMKSLMMATRAIDRLHFFGTKLDPKQPLEFPRKHNTYHNDHYNLILGPTVSHITANDPYNNLPKATIIRKSDIPNDIKIASCEIALKYLEGVDPEEEMNNMNSLSQRISSVHEAYSFTTVLEAFRAGINSSVAWTYLKPYLSDPHQIRLGRI